MRKPKAKAAALMKGDGLLGIFSTRDVDYWRNKRQRCAAELFE
jgi:hypothetical protein